MRIGSFEVIDPLPELHEPHALAMLRPWVDVGSVGSLTLSRLEAHLESKELGRLARPGSFFDFTRYRPIIYKEEGRRQVAIPNTFVTYAQGKGGNDFLFLHLLEPHMLGEVYVDSLLQLLGRFSVKRYCLLGSMYDLAPHTRPLLVTGGGVGVRAEAELRRVGVQPSDYQGPTTITYLISQRAPELGMETMSLIVHLPQYTQLDEDCMGLVRVMEVLALLYDVPVAAADRRQAEQQRKQIDAAAAGNAQLRQLLAQLEARYDDQAAKRAKQEEEIPRLSPEVERFLKEMDRRFRQG